MFGRKRRQDDFNAEIEAHLQLEVERLKEQGLNEEDALVTARRSFGNVTLVQERFYESGRWLGWDNLIHDFRFAFRQLRKHAGFATVAILIIALGIGANTTIFVIADSLFLRLPPLIAAPDELVRFTLVYEDGRIGDSMPYPDYAYYRENNGVFKDIMAYRYSRTAVAIEIGDRFAQATAGFVSANYFDVLGVAMAQGRPFLPEENAEPGTHPVVILGAGFWKRQLGSGPNVVGRVLSLNGNPFTVVGIAPERFRGVSPVEEPPDLFLPAMMRGFGLQRIDGQFSNSWNVIGRLRPGKQLSQVQAYLDVLQARWRDEFASWIAATKPPVHRIVLTPRFQLSPGVRQTLHRLVTLFFSIAGAVLMIACVNVALLLLARATGRQREIGIRCALGAGSGRIVRQLLTESMMLALAGGAGGILIASWGAKLVTSLIPIPFSTDFRPDVSVVLFALAVSAGAAVLFGLAPTWLLARGNLVSQLSRESETRGRSTFRNGLVVAQLAICTMLLMGTGLFSRSLIAALRVDLGFEPEQKLLVSLSLPAARYDQVRGTQFVQQILEQMTASPGIKRISTTEQIPFGGRWTESIRVPGRQHGNLILETGCNRIGPRYFETMHTPLRKGREFAASDHRGAPPVAVVNEELAERLWPGEDALGKSIIYGGREWAVIGVVRNSVYYDVGEAPQTQFYVPQFQDYSPIVTFVAAASGSTHNTTTLFEETIRRNDPGLPIFRISSLQDLVRDEISPYRVTAIMAALFGACAMCLAAIGLYGVQSYLVASRRREIGIRMALGAPQRHVAAQVIGRGLFLAVIGVLLGILGVLASGRLIENMLFGVKPRDPMTMLTIPVVLLFAAFLASFVPALRASKTQPMEALRNE